MRDYTGQTAVTLLVPEAEPVVRAWRQRFDISAAASMPAHITLLYPFLPQSQLLSEDELELARLCAAQTRLDIGLTRTGRFPGVLYLAPDPAQPLRQLTQEIAARWPQAPPYGGAFAEVIPHLTVAHDIEPQQMEQIEAQLAPQLPLTACLSEAWLYAFEGRAWRPRTRLPFAG